jgi:hypothetical protein
MNSDEWGVAAAVTLFEQRGFIGSFHVASTGPAELVCGSCGHRVPPGDAEVVDLFRFEGVSDPDDQALVAALNCRLCEYAGTFVIAYGPGTDANEAEVIAGLGDIRRRT